MSDSRVPVTLAIDYPEGPRNRATCFFRPFVAIPILVILVLISGPWQAKDAAGPMVLATGGILFLPTLLMLLFRWKYPRWWFDWNLNLAKFQLRAGAYLFLLADTYPSTDEEQGVHVELPYPDPTRDLKVGLPLVKWFLSIPHYVVLAGLLVAAVVATIIAWFAILFTGRHPRGLFTFVSGVMRWGLREPSLPALREPIGSCAIRLRQEEASAWENSTDASPW